MVWLDGGLHATEVVGAQQLIELVYQMVSEDDPETLRILEGIDMPKADKEKIWHGNLERITGAKLSK